MRTAKYFSSYLAAALAAFLLGSAAFAAPYTYVVAFGDSLSDNGNTYANTSPHYPGAPYYQGRHTNGPVTPEDVAQIFGATLRDFAYDGATTGIGNVLDGGDTATMAGLPGMTTAFQAALMGGHIPVGPSVLYMIWGGANDFRELTAKGPAAVIGTAVTNEMTIAGTLAFLGASNVYVLGLPDLSLTPKFQAADAATLMGLHMASMAYNDALKANLPPGVKFYDTNALFLDIYNNPGKYGLTDARHMCYDEAADTVCGNPDQYLFWDDYHPTAAVDRIVAGSFAQFATPEPATIYLFATAVVALLAGRSSVRKLRPRAPLGIGRR